MVGPCINILPRIGSDFWQIISQWERRPSSLTLTGPQYENLMRFMNSHSVDHRSGSSLFSIPMMRTIDLICSLDHILRSNQLSRQCWNSKSRENCTSKWNIFNNFSILKSLIMVRCHSRFHPPIIAHYVPNVLDSKILYVYNSETDRRTGRSG